MTFINQKSSQLGYTVFWNECLGFAGLSHEQNLHKMRILTLMQMAETRSEIDFDTIQQEMRLGADDVEAFVIDGKGRHWLIANERRVECVS